MNYTVFLGLLSGEMLFANTYVLFSMPKVKTKSPPKSKTKQTQTTIITKPTPLTLPYLIHVATICGVCLKCKKPQDYFLLFKEKEKVLRRGIKRSEIILSHFHIPLFHSNVIQNIELSLLLLVVFT